ncbi:MAG: hypothetical protein ABR968_12995 [Bacteroidales bacterium]|jgi:outer membrane lipoprotein-sorting protein
MKKLFIYAIVIMMSALVSCSGGGKKSGSSTDSTKIKDSIAKAASNGMYKLKSGIVTMVTETMGMKQTITMYFDDYGNKRSNETSGEIDMGALGKTEMHNLSFTKDGYMYNIDLVKKTGTKVKAPTSGNHKDIDFSKLSDDMMKQMKITKQGTEVVLGKTCDKYFMDDPTLKMKSTYCVWNGIPLKSEVDMGGMKATVTATKIQENVSVPADRFEIPKGITVREITTPKM